MSSERVNPSEGLQCPSWESGGWGTFVAESIHCFQGGLIYLLAWSSAWFCLESLKEAGIFWCCGRARGWPVQVRAKLLLPDWLLCVFLVEELKEHLLGDSAIDRIFTLGNSEFPVSWDNEVKLWTFLEDRASLLLKTYKTTIEVIRSMNEDHVLLYF